MASDRVFSKEAMNRRMTQKAGKPELSPSNTKSAGSMIKGAKNAAGTMRKPKMGTATMGRRLSGLGQ